MDSEPKALQPEEGEWSVRDPAYYASKAGLDKLAAVYAEHFTPFNVAAISLWPGYVATERLTQLMESDPGVKQFKEKMGLESTELSGRVIRALYDDPNLLTLSGKTIITAERLLSVTAYRTWTGTSRNLCVGSMAALILHLISNKNGAVLRPHPTFQQMQRFWMDRRLLLPWDYFRVARDPGSSKDSISSGVRAICSLSIIGVTLCAGQQCVELCAVRVQVSRSRSSISAMRSVERRNFLKVAVALPFAPPLRSFAEVASPLGKPVFVAAGADATGTEHHGPRAGTHLDFKVLTKDTQAGFFLIEHRNVPQGGPVRHLHYAQEEWFYLIEGNKVLIEVGDKRFTLRPGDSILAPRNVPHVWAYVGEEPGRMLMGFTPAGQMEDFFTLSSKQPMDAKIAEAHGMKWLGPPLDVSKL